MQSKTTSVAAVSASVGLSIHKGKTMILKYNNENTNTTTLNGETLEQVNKFTCLDSIIDEQRGSESVVMLSVSNVRTTFTQLKNIRNSKQLSTNIKVRIFNMDVIRVSSMVWS
ncbi:unnamed protein product [Schistosoma margrebowiei]|uniref:Uncharacterized protein n=1 Tax=Schistosoma margrebowiei TaxID=48269 RepID=A0A183MNR7_9TREM|nr:unnamed protein product [Schistosoma margrebowiei]